LEEPIGSAFSYWKCSSRESHTATIFMATSIAYNLLLLICLTYLAYKVHTRYTLC
jgi:hypothetical protein